MHTSDLYLHNKFHWNWKNYVDEWTDIETGFINNEKQTDCEGQRFNTIPSSVQAVMSWFHSHRVAGDSLPFAEALTQTSSCSVECRRVYLTVQQLLCHWKYVVIYGYLDSLASRQLIPLYSTIKYLIYEGVITPNNIIVGKYQIDWVHLGSGWIYNGPTRKSLDYEHSLPLTIASGNHGSPRVPSWSCTTSAFCQ